MLETVLLPLYVADLFDFVQVDQWKDKYGQNNNAWHDTPAAEGM